MPNIEEYGYNPPHVGYFVRNIIFNPAYIDGRRKVIETVGDAAELLKIGRSALSNVLNGNADLSVALATKIEDVFRYKAESLLVYQTKYHLLKYRLDVGSKILPVFHGEEHPISMRKSGASQ